MNVYDVTMLVREVDEEGLWLSKAHQIEVEADRYERSSVRTGLFNRSVWVEFMRGDEVVTAIPEKYIFTIAGYGSWIEHDDAMKEEQAA